MTTIEDIRQAIDANANDSRMSYWSACETLARSDATDKQREAALKKAARAAHEIGADADQIESDVTLLRSRNAMPNFDEMKRDGDAESRQLVTEAASLEGEADALDVRAKQLRQQAIGKRHSARSIQNAANNASQDDRKVRTKLVERGHPGSLIEKRVEMQQQELQRARNAVTQAEHKLAESVEALETARKDEKRHSTGGGYDPIANHVERRQRDLTHARSELAALESSVETEVDDAVEPQESAAE